MYYAPNGATKIHYLDVNSNRDAKLSLSAKSCLYKVVYIFLGRQKYLESLHFPNRGMYYSFCFIKFS